MKTKESKDKFITINDHIAIGNETKWKNDRKGCNVYIANEDLYIFIGELKLIKAISSNKISVFFKTHSKNILIGDIYYIFSIPMHIDKDVLGTCTVNNLIYLVDREFNEDCRPSYTYRDMIIRYDRDLPFTYEVYTNKIEDGPLVLIERMGNSKIYEIYKPLGHSEGCLMAFMHNNNPFIDSKIMKQIYKTIKPIEKELLKENNHDK